MNLTEFQSTSDVIKLLFLWQTVQNHKMFLPPYMKKKAAHLSNLND